MFSNTATTIGIRIPNVPHDVPVANPSKQAITNIIPGRKLMNEPALCSTKLATYGAAPRLSVIAFKDHANVRIKIGGTIALNPSGIHSMQSVKLKTFLEV